MQFKIKRFFRSLLNNPLIFNIATVLFITYGLKILGFFKESYVASEFGLSELIDTYILAMIIPLLIQSVFLRSFSNVFGYTIVSARKIKRRKKGCCFPILKGWFWWNTFLILKAFVCPLFVILSRRERVQSFPLYAIVLSVWARNVPFSSHNRRRRRSRNKKRKEML